MTNAPSRRRNPPKEVVALSIPTLGQVASCLCAMGVLQMMVDVWLGTTAFAFARRAGIVSAPNFQRIANDQVRSILTRYVQFGERSADVVQEAIRRTFGRDKRS